MEAECATFEITRMARLLHVSPSGFYRWRKSEGSTTHSEVRRSVLDAAILAAHETSNGTYGARGSPKSSVKPALRSARTPSSAA